MIQAINELKKDNINLENLVDEYIKSNETLIKDNKLYYKTKQEGLMYLNYYKFSEELKLTNKFKTFGTMLDVSRGAVFKVEYVKKLIRRQALLGVNEIWMYMEDIYPVEGYPFFGYLRGRYTKNELKEIVEYAKIFDIKIIPAMQTLGHMEQFLKWHNSRFVKDQHHVLLVEYEDTYKLIDNMFKSLKDIFQTDKIHIGLDETFGLGFGRYYKQNGYKPQKDIFIDHLIKVNDLAIKNGFKDVLIWSDMLFRIASVTESYYDPTIKFSEELLAKIPENISLVYWDYYNTDLELIKSMLRVHKNMNRKVIFASGTWTWVKFTYDKTQTDKTANTHIKACLEEEIDELILTQWMDDGAYVDHETSLLGVYEIGLNALTKNNVNEEIYEYITKDKYTDAILRTKLNDVEINPQGLMWDDPLLGIYVNNYVGNNYYELLKHSNEYYKLSQKFANNKNLEFVYLISLANHYKLKARFLMIKNYFNNQKLSPAINEFKKFKKAVKKLMKKFNKIWHEKNKLIGLEAIQSRFATLMVRADEMIYIIKKYDKGEIKKIEAFEYEVGEVNQLMSLKHIGLAYSMRPY